MAKHRGFTNIGAWGRHLTPREQKTIKRNAPNFSPTPTPSPTPSPSPTPTPTLPPDPAYANTVVSNQRNLGIANADYAYQKGRLQQRFGLDDTSNPFSEAALLRENFLRSQRGTTNSYAASGQLYSGALGRAQSENVRNYSIADDRMRRDYADLMHNLDRGMLDANANYGANITAADWDRLMRQFGGGR